MSALEIYKGLTNTFEVDFGYDISGDTFTSKVRSEPDQGATEICEFTVSWLTDGTDGILVLVLDDLESGQITVDSGYMDVRRVTGGEPVPTFSPIPVEFKGTVS